MPYYLNNFAVEREKELRSMGVYNQSCEIILSLGKWLNLKNYSPYVLVPYDEK